MYSFVVVVVIEMIKLIVGEGITVEEMDMK